MTHRVFLWGMLSGEKWRPHEPPPDWTGLPVAGIMSFAQEVLPPAREDA